MDPGQCAACAGTAHQVYEFVTRRYLACISDDARGDETVVEVDMGGEAFSGSGTHGGSARVVVASLAARLARPTRGKKRTAARTRDGACVLRHRLLTLDAGRAVCRRGVLDMAGLVVTARNYLDVYPYEQWSNRTIPPLQLHERFVPAGLELQPGQTTAPDMLSEADLITLMDKNGIGERAWDAPSA